MARAKRIDHDRAEARRRYRAATATTSPEPLEDDDPATGAAEAAAGSSGSAGSPGSAGATARSAAQGNRARPSAQPLRARMGLREAFFASYRPIHLREDIARLPRLVRHWSVWVPILAAVVSTVLPFVLGSGNELARFAFSIFVSPGAVAGVFIAGYFAPRSAYLAGLIVALASSVLFSLFAYALTQGAIDGTPAEITSQVIGDQVLTAFIIGPLYGIFLGATAAWYKRFLASTAPPRPARPAAQTGKQRRGPRPKTR